MKLILRIELIFALFVDTPRRIILPMVALIMEIIVADIQSLRNTKKAVLQFTHLGVAIAPARKFQ